MTEAEYRAQVDARVRQVVEAMAADASSLWCGHALLATPGDGSRLTPIIKAGLGHSTPGSSGRVSSGTFEVIAAMTMVLRGEGQLEAEAVAHVKEVLTQGILHRDNTENHWLMHYTASLLAAERWPEVKRWGNGLSPEAVRAESMRWILGTIDRTARLGHHEYDSPIYHILHMVCMMALADHAGDPHLRSQAEKVLALFVADLALEYFHGAWAGGHSREGDRQNTWTHSGSISGLQYIYFGGDFDPDLHADGRLGPALTSGYRPPRVFMELAHQRKMAHVVRKTRAPRTIFRHARRDAAPVRKYTYMSPSFALGSTQLGLPGPPAGPIDLVSWDLTWYGPRHDAKVVSNHPHRDPGRMSAFLSETPQTIGDMVALAKPHLMVDDRFCGASPYEQMMQHRGTIVLLHQIPPGDDCPFVNLYLPRSIDWVERDGWILGSVGSFHVGLRLIGAYTWDDLKRGQVDGWMVRLQDPNAGLVLEAAEAADAGDFDAFCGARTSASLDLGGWPEGNRVLVDTTSGDRLEMNYGPAPEYSPGAHRVNGQAIDYGSYPLYDAPGVEAPLGTGRMQFSCEGASLALDFGVDPEKEPIPMRVVG